MYYTGKKCPYSELFWSAFSSIRTEYGEIQSMYFYVTVYNEIFTWRFYEKIYVIKIYLK